MNRVVVQNPYSATIALGLRRGYSLQIIHEAEIISSLQRLQDDLIAQKKIYLSANCYTSNVILSGQVEPHMNLTFINYPRFQLNADDRVAEALFKTAVEDIARELMAEFGQNRLVIQFHDSNVMLEQSSDVDPAISGVVGQVVN
jgi:hypothetical protein